MRKYFGAAAVVVFLLAIALAVWGGERITTESPISSIPSLLIDYHEDETEIFVHGLNDFRYTNITLRVTADNTTQERFREDAYFIYYNTTDLNFTLNITVWNKNKQYSFNGSIQVANDTESTKVLTLYEVTKTRINDYMLTETGLPWKKFMERVV
jgi:hypothetical protein